ncbi:arsenic resistance protein [Halorubrum ezzemoulense]|uniref:arsenic resistance protein n=1 Tax=Halorubrum ezzemoulense TaxID=337243 RepID=UPI0023309378|nr:arsenic resistance protein [Halorubrum ezzemoulense]MDB9251983.1 arsenic resistance protein [Halorubrum ezzemoulense]MDB9254617.1 arsenic resistance protein [Halorubrum ezzemoulense]MDB9275328.1 arsenic resistance protein [Halorubrum ezzemoulense]
MIRRFLTGIKSNLIYVVVGSLAAGLIVGQFTGASFKRLLQSAVVPVLFLMIYPMMINIDLREVVNVRSHARVVALSLLVNFGVAPLLAVGLARLFFDGSVGYAFGLYFIALIPTSGMTAAWTGLANGDLESALVAMAVNLLVAVAVLPTYLAALIPASVGFDAAALYGQLARVVVLPMIAGTLTRRVLLGRLGADGFRRLKPTLGGLSSFGVMLIVFIAMAMRSESILADPVASGATIVPIVAFYALLLAVGSGLGRALRDAASGVALVYATSMRNLSIAVAVVVAAPAVPETAVLPITLAYVVQPPLGAVYMHYRRDIADGDASLSDAVASII